MKQYNNLEKTLKDLEKKMINELIEKYPQNKRAIKLAKEMLRQGCY